MLVIILVISPDFFQIVLSGIDIMRSENLLAKTRKNKNLDKRLLLANLNRSQNKNIFHVSSIILWYNNII